MIATNIPDAQETVNSIVEDWEASKLEDRRTTWIPNGKVVSKEGWKQIDAVEIADGEAKGKEREKMVDVSAMLEICC